MLSRRSILVATFAVGAAAITPALAASPQPFDAKAFDDALKTGKPILIAIHATWCPTCMVQKPILSSLTADPKFSNLAYFVIDFDSQKELVRKFGARVQSTLIAFKGGKEQGRTVGDTDVKSIADLLNKAL